MRCRTGFLLSSLLLSASLCCPGIVSAQAPAQALGQAVGRSSAQPTETDLAARLVGKPLYLRGAWGGSKLHFDGSGEPAKLYKVVPFTTAGIEVGGVRLRDGHLEISGRRVGLEFDPGGDMTREALFQQGDGKDGQIRITVDATPGGAFGPALAAIFTDDLSGIPSACSSFWRDYCEKHWPSPGSAGPDAASTTRGTHSAGPARTVGGRIKPPRLLKQVNPEFSPAARSVHYSGTTRFSVRVEKDGSLSDIQVIRPGGLGLDERAHEALLGYKLAPAEEDGLPVAVVIQMEVNFQIFER